MIKFNSNYLFIFVFLYRTHLDNTADIFLTQNDGSSDLRSNGSPSGALKLPQITASTTT